MKTINFRVCELLVDSESTKQTYQKIEGGIADGCKCSECKNFIANRENVFPEEVKVLLTELGIDYHKECENIHLQKLKNGLHFYHFWFHFKGKIISPNYESDSTTIFINNNLSLSFGKVQHPSFFTETENITQVEFHAEIPWIIEDKFDIK